MNVTNNLKLPQYTEEDIFDLQDVNKAYDSIDNAYKEVIDFKNEIPKTNATAEVINARGGKETLGKRLDEFGSQLDTIVSENITINLSKYEGFKNVGYNGNIDTFIEKALNELKTKLFNPTTGWRNALLKILIPGGRYKITKNKAFNFNSTSFNAVQGIIIEGVGQYNTIIEYDNDEDDNFLFYNDGSIGYFTLKNIQFLGKNGTEGFFNVNGSSNTATFNFDSVHISNFLNGFYFNGKIMTSEVCFLRCRISKVPINGYGIKWNNPQGVNINLISTHIENVNGVGIEFLAGGCMNIFGGSFISNNNGVLFKLDNSNSSGIGTGNWEFNFWGIRTEVKEESYLLYNNSGARINFNSCSLVNKTTNNTDKIELSNKYGRLRFNNCTFDYKIKINVGNSDHANDKLRIKFDNCSLISNLNDLVSLNGDVGNNFTAYPEVYSINCGDDKDISLFSYKSLNCKDTLTKKIKMYTFGSDRLSAIPKQTASTILPENSIVTKVYLVLQDNGVTPSSGMQYDVLIGSTKVLSTENFTTNIVKSWSSHDIFIYCDNGNNVLTITNNGNYTTYGRKGCIVVEYI